MDSFWLDVRYALRQIRRRPVFTVVAALSLAVGVGANTAIFSAVSAILLRPVQGVAAPERVVEVGRTSQGRGFDTFSYPDYRDLADEVTALASTAAFSFEIFSFSRGDEGERITGMHTSASYFDVMGVVPSRGRFFAEAEDAPGATGDVVVLSHRFWQDRLAGDPDLVGRTVRVNRRPFTVVGIAAEDFNGHAIGFQPDVYLPLRSSPLLRESADVFEQRNSQWHMVVARLAPDATLEGANTQIEALFGRLAQEYESHETRGARAVRLGLVPGAGRGGVAGFLAVLMGMVTLILVVTCANVAGMFLARGSARQKEIAVRLAIGSGRKRLVRQLVTEALAVFAIGGAIGGVIGVQAMAAVPIGRLPVPIPIHVDLSPDLGVLLFGIAVTLVTGLVFGLLPALQATRLDLVSSLKEEGLRGGAAGGLRRFFVAGQVGLSLVLLVSAGLFTRSLQRAADVETGFDPTGAYITSVDLDLEGYDETSGPVLQRGLLERLREVPGVQHASLATDFPLDLGSRGTSVFPEGWGAPGEQERFAVDFNDVAPDYFASVGIDLLEGRDFTGDDIDGAQEVVIVSRYFAERAWPGEAALGKTVRVGGFEQGIDLVVIGVVGDVKNQLVTEAEKPFMYLPLFQRYRATTNVVVRADGGIAAVAPALRAAILEQDPGMSLSPVISLERYTSIGVLPQRVAASITSVLGALALLLAGLGVYGVVAFAVHRRTREIGVRMALGAGQGRIVTGVVASGLMLALPGVVFGGAAALGVGYLLRFLLLGLNPADPVALIGVSALLLTVVTFAAVVPARRAARTEPVEALRAE